MKKLFSLLLISSLIVVACEKSNEIEAQATITITQDVVELAADGGEAEVSFTIDGDSNARVTIKEDASWLETKVEGNIIKLTAKANTTATTREVVVTAKCSISEDSFTVKQAASQYDVVFEAKRFEGAYFGTEYSDTHNYYIILSDVGVKTDASVKANGKYYYFDMYRSIAADEMNPILPDGEYKLDATNSYANETISEESSWYAETDDNGKVAKSASYTSATVTVKNGKFSAIIEMEDGKTHYVSYAGELSATTHLTTLSGDKEFAIEGATVSAVCYGDTYEKGQQTWFIEAVKGNDYFCYELLSPSAELFDGIYQALEPSGVTDYSNKFIPGLLGEGLLGTWYAKLTDGVIKGDEMAPMTKGMIQITKDGINITINYSCKDDGGNNITGSVKGTLQL